MPQKRRNNNKKKNKSKGKFGGRPKGPITSNIGSAAASNTDSKATRLKGEAPKFWENLKQGNLQQAFPTVYARYKNATKRFQNYMKNACPSEMEDGVTANSLMAASDVLVNTGHVMDRSILKDLKLSIRIRSRVATSVYGGGDAGHKYFLDVLTYCWSILNSLPKTTKDEEKHAAAASEDGSENPFQALMEDDEEEDDIGGEEDEKMFPSEPVKRPSSPPGAKPLTLDELRRSDERNDVIFFLLSLEEIMHSVSQQYRTTVMHNFNNNRRHGTHDAMIVEELMEAAVATNMAIQQVQQLEMDLLLQHEHLTTPYRLLATLVLPEITQTLTATVREHGRKEGCTEKDISVYLGDCLESSCRNPSDPCNRKEELVVDFCDMWQVDSTGRKEFKEYFEALRQLVVYEMPVGPEKGPQNIGHFQGIAGLPGSHSWIKNMPSIGEDRAIQHTLRLLQTFRHVIHGLHEDKCLTPIRGGFGPHPWRANPFPGKRIRDLDELFMTQILPNWVLMCRKGILGICPKLPFEDEVCPLFALMREYVQEPEKPVTWSITFAIHAMLTAILEVEPIFDRLVDVSRAIFERYFEQLEWAKNLANQNTESLGTPNSPEAASWWHNMISVTFLENLGLPVYGDRTIWNPLCAGTIFSYLNYFGNLEAGCAMIDCQAQLRITLHLYHALMANGIVHEGQMPMLDRIYDAFRGSKAIWEGRSLPKKGEFVQRFWICFGVNVVEARKMSDDAKQIIREVHQMPSLNNRQPPRRDLRKLVSIEASDISKSYRRICNRDFHDVVDKYHTPEQRRKYKDTDFYRLMVNTNDTLDAIDEEQALLSLNLPSCGAIIEQFVNSLGRVLQWEPLLQAGAAQMPGVNDQRQIFAFLFAQYVLGALDFADDPFGYEFMRVPLGEASSSFMVTYFSKLNPDKALWFQPTAAN